MKAGVVVALAILAGAGAGPAATADAPAVATREVEFVVHNPTDVAAYRVHATLYQPARSTGCARSALILVSGLSYSSWAWDFPVSPERYSTARALAAAGYPVVAVDLPGYGRSTKPDGRLLTIPSYASMISQIASQLKLPAYGGPRFEHVGLVGHSAGTEIAEVATALYDIDLLVATGYTHFPSQRIATDFLTGDYVRAAQGGYEYFGDTPEQRREYMYNEAVDDPAVMDLDTALAEPTPSGEVLTIGPQPSRALVPLIDVPVMLVIGEDDILFPSADADTDLALFVQSPSTASYVLRDAGHSLMLHPNAPDANAAIVSWLREPAQSSALPSCPV